MAFKSHWELNKEALVNKALIDYKEKNCPSAGFNILRYTGKNVLTVKEEYTDVFAEMCIEHGTKTMLPYNILRVAKLGGLEWNGQ